MDFSNNTDNNNKKNKKKSLSFHLSSINLYKNYYKYTIDNPATTVVQLFRLIEYMYFNYL